MNWLRLKPWSPYLVGALIGVLSWFSFASVDKPLGITTAFEYTAALAVRGVDPSAATENPYYKTAPGSEAELEGKEPKIDWEWMLVIGVAIGAAISSSLSGDRGSGEPVPRLWRERFGDGRARRYLWSFIGGGLLMLGARIAQGCTSGHGISGALQLAVSSWLFVVVFVATAIAAAMAIYRGKPQLKEAVMLESFDKLVLGLLTGIVFGFLLQKGRVAKFDVIVGQLLLRDHTVVKIMATAVIVGSIGVHALVAGGLATLHVKPALLGGVALGGVLFGLGMAILGYCPGTGVAAAGAGHRDAYAGVAGMLSGALFYVLAFRWIEPMLDAIADWGEVTLPEATSSSTWLWVGGVSVVLALLMAVLEKQRPGPEPAR